MPNKSGNPVRLVRTKIVVPDEKRKQFYDSIRITLLVSRCMGVMPIEGLRNKSSGTSRFTLKSVYSIIYAPSIILLTIFTVLLVCHMFWKRHNGQGITDFAACILTFSMLLTLTRFAMGWNEMLHDIETIESKLPPIQNYKKITTVMNSLMIFVLTMGFVEHALFTLFTWSVVSQCPENVHSSTNQLKSYYMYMYDWFFEFIPFSYFSAIVVQISVFQRTFIWNYNDVLIIVLSIYLTSRFKHFNSMLLQKQNNGVAKECSPSWSTLQVHNTRISRLVSIVDANIGSLILVSYAGNLLYIFKQIFYVINNIKGPSIIPYNKCGVHQRQNTISNAYVAFTTFHALIKSAMVSFLAAELHTASRAPLSALHTVPAATYNNDMQRLMNQVYYSKVCLTGCKLFSITRSMILVMLATLLTYEVVLFQF